MAPDDPRCGRLLGEARLAASVSHPNLVEVFDVAEDEEGPFMVMEFVEAPSLAAGGSELSRQEAMAVVSQVAGALAAIHKAGIVHRDVQPSVTRSTPPPPSNTSINEDERSSTQNHAPKAPTARGSQPSPWPSGDRAGSGSIFEPHTAR